VILRVRRPLGRRFASRILPAAATILCIVAISSPGCGRTSPDSAGHRFETTLEDGIPTAVTTGGPLYEGSLFAFDPIMTLRQDPSVEGSALYRPRAVTIGPDGDYFVLDSGNSRVAVFDAAGNYLRSFGREGQGPGEFSNLASLQSLRGDVLSIFDFQSQRTSLFRTDGTLIDDFSNTGVQVMNLERGPSGRIIMLSSGFDLEDDPGIQSRRVRLFAADGGDALAEISTGKVKSQIMELTEMPGGQMIARSMPVPFAGHPSAVHAPDRGFLLTDGDKPELRWYDYAGDLAEVVRIDLPQPLVTEEMKRQYDEDRRRRLIEAAERDGREPPQLSELEFPERVGCWQSVVVDDYGYVWLQAVTLTYDHPEGAGWTFIVLAPDGRYLGQAELPVRRPFIRDGKLMGFVADPETGETEVGVFAIRPLPEGLAYPGDQ